MRRLGLVLGMLLCLLGVAVTGQAQPNPLQGPQTITVVDAGACATAGACASFSMNNFTVGTLEVSGTFTGTLTPEVLVNSVWVAVTLYDGNGLPFTTVTAPGAFSVANTGLARVRLRAGAFASGTATVVLRQGYFIAKLPGTGSRILAANGTSTLPSYSFASEPGIGFYRSAIGFIGVANDNGSTPTHTFGPASFNMGSGAVFTWAAVAAAASGTGDTGLSRTAAGTVAVGNGTAGDLTGTLRANTFISGGEYQAGTNFQAPTAGAFYWSGKTLIKAPADGIVTLTNQAATTGSEFKTDALPTIASGFGTSPSITAGSTPLAGQVNVGTGGTATSGAINFNGTAFPSAPFCIATASLGTTPTIIGAISTTQLTLTVGTAWPASTLVNWHCISPK